VENGLLIGLTIGLLKESSNMSLLVIIGFVNCLMHTGNSPSDLRRLLFSSLSLLDTGETRPSVKILFLALYTKSEGCLIDDRRFLLIGKIPPFNIESLSC